MTSTKFLKVYTCKSLHVVSRCSNQVKALAYGLTSRRSSPAATRSRQDRHIAAPSPQRHGHHSTPCTPWRISEQSVWIWAASPTSKSSATTPNAKSSRSTSRKGIPFPNSYHRLHHEILTVGGHRQALRYMIRNTSLPQRTRAQAQLQLTQMHCYTRPTQIRNRCIMGGKGRGVLRDFRMSRFQFRMNALAGKLPGVKKASW